ncbi:MAG: hypothetical protein D6820_12890, partial [Lentisphaerae bacterium]
AQKAPIYLFRVLMEAAAKAKDPQKAKSLTERAVQQSNALIKQLPGQSLRNLRYIAFGLVKKNDAFEYETPAPKLVLAALDELLKRLKSTKDESEKKQLKRLEEKALYYKSIVLTLLGKELDALKVIDKILATNKKSAYLFRLYTQKAVIYFRQKKYNEALRAIAEVTTKADRTRYKVDYWNALLLLGRIYLGKETKAATQRAVLTFQSLKEYIDKNDKELQPFKEAGYYYLARCYALLGQHEKANEVQTEYLRLYPTGKWRKLIGKLPNPAY